MASRLLKKSTFGGLLTGPGGDCAPMLYDRIGNTVTRSDSSSLQFDFGCTLGDCVLDLKSTRTFGFESFGAGVTVLGNDIHTFSASGGDCSCVSLPCTAKISSGGDDCAGCFSCAAPPPLENRDALGRGGLSWALPPVSGPHMIQ